MAVSTRTQEQTLLLGRGDKEFADIFHKLSYSRGADKVFADFLDYTLYILSAGMICDDYNNFIEKYTSEELSSFVRMLILVSEASENFEDVLGNIFMSYVSFGRNGQFFTPSVIGDLMSEITGVDLMKPDQSTFDPACGSGVLLLCATKKLVSKYPNGRIFCYGADIDLTCVKMATINFFMNSIPGEIAWMNSLTNEHWRSYCISLKLIDGMYYPILSVKEAGDTNMIVRIEKSIEEGKLSKEMIKASQQLSFDF